MRMQFGFLGGASRGAIAGLAIWGAVVGAQAQSIESVSGSIQGSAEVVRIDLSEPPSAPPVGFVVQSPARIALDFQGVKNGMSQAQVDLGNGNARSARVVQVGDRTRVVLNLNQPTAYSTDVQGRSVFVTLNRASAAAPVPEAQRLFAESRNDSTLPLRDVDFRRGVENAGRVVVDLANSQVGVDIHQQGQNLIVEFLRTSLPEGLRRRLDVADFGTPVQTITTTQTGDRVKMVNEPKGTWEYSAY